MAKKDTLKSSLIKKKPIIDETKASKVVEKIHKPVVKKEEEETVKTSVDFRKSLYKAMKIKLIEDGKTMREYLEELIEADIKK
jgi:hypothetical protein